MISLKEFRKVTINTLNSVIGGGVVAGPQTSEACSEPSQEGDYMTGITLDEDWHEYSDGGDLIDYWRTYGRG